MLTIFRVVAEVIAIIVALVQIVERPGDGATKRQQVVEMFMAQAREHLNLPTWAENLFLRESFIGWLVDVVVWAANMYGFFTSSQPQTG